MKTYRNLFLVLVASLSAYPITSSAMEYYGISKPSSEAAIGFSVPGRVTAVLIKDGDQVKPGDLLAEQDGSVLDARIEQMRLEAGSSVEIDASKAALAQREQEVKKIKQAHEKGSATDLELERAELEVVISRFRVKAAEEKRDMAVLKLKEAEAERNQLYLKSSVPGRIEKLRLELGEAPKPMEPVMLIVNCDPLWIEVPLPLADATALKPGMDVKVRFPDGSRGDGRVLVISSVADAASETVSAKLTMPNPENRRAGERVGIILPDGVGRRPVPGK